jgi:hypothetical protein
MNILLSNETHSGLKQVISPFTLGSTRAVLVVALAYSFPDVFNVIMALISPYTNQPFIVPIQRTSIVVWASKILVTDPNGIMVAHKFCDIFFM